MQELVVLIGAGCSIIVLVTLGKLNRQLDKMARQGRELQDAVRGMQSVFNDYRKRMERKMDRFLGEGAAVPTRPSDIAWKG